MKVKKYVKPKVEVIEVETEHVIAVSGPSTSKGGHSGEGVARSPERFWDEGDLD